VRRHKNWLITGLIITFLMPSSLRADTSGVSLLWNGERYLLKNQPIVKSGTSLIGMRELFEILGAEVEWDANKKIIKAQKDENYIELKVGTKDAYKNGEKIELSLAPEIKDGVTFVPLRWIAEALDAQVEWNKDEAAIYITTKENINPAEEDPSGEKLSDEKTRDESVPMDNNLVENNIPKLKIEAIEYKNARELSLEDVKRMAVGGNISLRLQNLAAERAEEAAVIASRTPMVSDGLGGYVAIEEDAVVSLLRRSTADMGAEAAKKQKELIKESVQFMAEKAYYEIVELEEQLAITQASVELSRENLDIIRKRYELGLESRYNLSQAEMEQEQLEKQLETLKLSLDSKYTELNNLIGQPTNMRYILNKNIGYKPLEDISLKGHISDMISKDFYVWYSKKAKELKDLERKSHSTTWTPNGESYSMKDNEYKQAELSEEATIKNLEKSLESRYNQILQLEKQIEAQKLNIEKAKESYRILIQQYKLGMIIPLKLKQGELAIHNAELELQKLMAQHNQLKTAFYNPALMPDYAN
jgi:hypothetical protein